MIDFILVLLFLNFSVSRYLLFLKIHLFLLKVRVTATEGKTESSFHVSLFSWPWEATLAQPMPEARNFSWLSHKGGRGSNSWTTFSSIPGPISKELDQKYSVKVTNQYPCGLLASRQQLFLSQLNSGPKKIIF